MPTLVEEQFSNKAINTDTLPEIQDLYFEALSPKYFSVRRWLHFSITFLLLLLGLIIYYQPFYSLPEGNKNIILLVSLSVFSLSLLISIYLIFSDKHKFFALREQDISYASGLVFKSIVTQPMLRIQHVELKQGPIERKVKLAKLQIFSAGGALHTFEIPGLKLEKAKSIRQFILDHKTLSSK